MKVFLKKKEELIKNYELTHRLMQIIIITTVLFIQVIFTY